MGTHKIGLDSRRKIKLPVRWVELLGAGAVLTKGIAGCAMLMPAPVWGSFSQKLLGLPMSADPWKRIFLGSAEDASVDSRRSLAVPDQISRFIGAADFISAIGVGHHIELWDPQRLADSEAKALSEPLPIAISEFTF